MKLLWEEIQSNAIAFSKKWKGIEGRERQQAQTFVREFLAVFGIDDPLQNGEGEFEYVIKGNYIDYLWKKQIAIEMKGKGKDSDLKRAFAQTREKYMPHLSDDEFPDLWLLCDFENIHLTRHSTKETFKFKTADLRKHIKRFANIAGYETERGLGDQIEVNVKAAEKMARLYDALKDHGYDGHELEVYLVRLLFCLFAGDTGIFPKGNFHNYILDSKADGSDLSHRLSDLFEVLNMPPEIRAKKKLLSDELKKFAYVNGRLFEEHLPKADFDAKTRKILLECRENFDWSTISPAIFGAMFQGVMDKTKRREMGAHYTSEENIEKLINPLFMDGLYKEFERVKTDPTALDRFHEKIARLKFLDPACGCGNFLIVTYSKLRELELEILKMKAGTNQLMVDIAPLLKVSVEQFYGIEYEEFPCQIAQVGMWLADHQMNLRVSEQFGMYFARLPLTQAAIIVHGNALRLDWEEVVPKWELSYILGNPPFVGSSMMSKEQKDDAVAIFGKIKLSNSIDYVGAWYHKAAIMAKNTNIRVAFVSTNSITQGEQVAPLWGKMFDEYGVSIDFAYRTFKWGNEAKGKAAVHCIIVGFSNGSRSDKVIYDGEETIKATNINAYLVNAPNVFIGSRGKPICDVPKIYTGNLPADGGNLILTAEEKAEIISQEPQAAEFIKPYVGAVELINGGDRYCIWLNGVSFSLVKKCPSVLRRIEKVRIFRLASSAKPTVEKADIPHLFFYIAPTSENYLAIPKTSSENRRYIPIGFMNQDTIVSDNIRLIPNATPYHFGILTSNVHNAWMRVVAGRLKSDYRYSGTIVYNNFPWVAATDEQIKSIEKLAQAILDARTKYPNSTFADMYGKNSMPFHPDLVKAHQNLDRAVMKLYGFPVKDFSEADIVAALMEMYQEMGGSASNMKKAPL